MNHSKRDSSRDPSSTVACPSAPFTTRLGSVSLWLLLFLTAFKGAGALPPERTLQSVISATGALVAVGNNGTILSSVNGGPQLFRDSSTTNALQSVVWGNGKYVAVGADGTLVTSSDAITWSHKRLPIQMASPRVAFGNGRFVVMGKGRSGFWSVLVSADAVDWTSTEVVSSGPASTLDGLPFGGLAFGAGKFLAAGGVDSANLVLTSVDGLLWNEQGTLGAVGGRNGAIEGPISYGAGVFVMKVTYINRDEYGNVFERIQSIVTSADGFLWRVFYSPVRQIHSLSLSDCGLLISSTNLSTNSVFLGLVVPSDPAVQFPISDIRWMELRSASALSVWDAVGSDGSYLAVGTDVAELTYSSSELPLLANPPPAVYPEGGSAMFRSVAPCLSSPTHYQWFFNSREIGGATNASLELLNLQTNQSGNYSFTLRGGSGLMFTGGPVQISVVRVPDPEVPTPVAPTLSGPNSVPTNQVPVGSVFDLSLGSSGWPTPALEWFRDGQPLVGGTNALLRLYDLHPGDAGQYSVIARNSAGSATSIVARVVVYQQAPENFTNEVSLQVVEGMDAQVGFDPLPFGTGLMTLQVVKDGQGLNVPLNAESRLGLFDVSAADEGTYSLLARNSLGQGSSFRVSLDVIPSVPLQVWRQRSPRPRSLFSVAYGAAGFVAVGQQSSIAISPDGREWSFHRLPAAIDFAEVAFGNGSYVAVGASGVLVSQDGVTWTVALIPKKGLGMASVAFAGGRFYLLATTELLTSVDGTSWSALSLPSVGYRQFNHLAFGNGVYVAVGGAVPIWTSANGVDWVPRITEISVELESVLFAEGIFVAVGDGGAIWTSVDGVSWKERDSDTSNRLRGVAYGNGKFIVVGNRGRVLSSTKGSNWKKEDSGQPNRLESVAFARGLFVAVGEDGVLMVSSDGNTWSAGHTGPTRDLDGMVSDSRRLILVGKGGTILTTTNGVDFSRSPTGLTNDLHGVGWSGSLYVAVGEPETILSSPDGVQWTVRNQSTNSSLKNVTWAAGMWVAVGTQGTIWTSLDGVSWTPRKSSTLNDLNDVAFGDGRFVVVGDNLPPNGTVLTSPDGVTWTRGNQYIGKNLRSVHYLNGNFVATANDGVLLVSTNGIQWEQHFTGFFNNLRAVGYAANQWVLVGNEGLILHSPQLTNWAFSYSPAVENLHQVTYFNSRFYAIGNRGTVVASDSFVRSAELAARVVLGQLELTVAGDMGALYRLEVSDRLPAISWTTVASFTMTENPQRIADPEPARMGARFYRVVSP